MVEEEYLSQYERRLQDSLVSLCTAYDMMGGVLLENDDIECKFTESMAAPYLTDAVRELQDKCENRPRCEVPHQLRPGAGALNRSTLEVPQELLRSRYCIKWELGLCKKSSPKEPLYLVNQGNRLRLRFDCANCEMVVERPN